MSYALRVAVAASSLLSFPACATTGSASTLETTTASEEGSVVGGGTVPQAARVSSRWWQNQLNPAPVDDAAALLSWERSRSASAGGVGNPSSLLFEPTDSRIRIVLNMPRAGGEAGGDFSESHAALGSAAGWLGAPALRPALLPGAGAAELFEPVPFRTQLAALGGDATDLLERQPGGTHNTPEPRGMALALIGLAATGWRCRRFVTATERSSRPRVDSIAAFQ